jgi:HAD superfamily hydrolase (TIGR01509 family)
MQQECKLIVFDLDGVLVEAKDLHFLALNMALGDIDKEFIISEEEHLLKYDGLPTIKKMEKLVEIAGFPKSKVKLVAEKKQLYTKKLIKQNIKPNSQISNTLSFLKKEGYTVAVASNSLWASIQQMLTAADLLKHVDYILGNDNVKHPKPNPEIYLKCMIEFGVGPQETLIVEDSEVGRKAAAASGARVCPVNALEDVSRDYIMSYIEDIKIKPPKWRDNKLNILIPMAGEGSRFAKVGYTFPKPLIDINGKPMIQVVVENLNIDARYIFIVKKEHYNKYNLKQVLNLIAPGCEIVILDFPTDGAAITTLAAEKLIDNDNPLLIANSDQYLEWDSSNFMYAATSSKCDGYIPVFEATHPKWSFVKLNEKGLVIKVAEKSPISNLATAGLYYWKRGSDYVKYTYKMTDKDIKTNGEFYIAPVYNEAIAEHQKIGAYHFDKMWGLGTPEDLQYFLQNFSKRQ